MVNSFVLKKDLDSEMTVVRNEFEMGENNAGGVLFQRMQQTAYAWHNYGNPIIGASVTFAAPATGPGGSFASGKTTTVTTNE